MPRMRVRMSFGSDRWMRREARRCRRTSCRRRPRRARTAPRPGAGTRPTSADPAAPGDHAGREPGGEVARPASPIAMVAPTSPPRPIAAVSRPTPGSPMPRRSIAAATSRTVMRAAHHALDHDASHRPPGSSGRGASAPGLSPRGVPSGGRVGRGRVTRCGHENGRRAGAGRRGCPNADHQSIPRATQVAGTNGAAVPPTTSTRPPGWGRRGQPGCHRSSGRRCRSPARRATGRSRAGASRGSAEGGCRRPRRWPPGHTTTRAGIVDDHRDAGEDHADEPDGRASTEQVVCPPGASEGGDQWREHDRGRGPEDRDERDGTGPPMLNANTKHRDEVGRLARRPRERTRPGAAAWPDPPASRGEEERTERWNRGRHAG